MYNHRYSLNQPENIYNYLVNRYCIIVNPSYDNHLSVTMFSEVSKYVFHLFYIIMYTIHICYMRYSWLLRRLKWKNVSPLWRRHHFFIIRCIYWNMRPTTISFDTFGLEYSLLQDVIPISILIDSLFAFDRSILNIPL